MGKTKRLKEIDEADLAFIEEKMGRKQDNCVPINNYAIQLKSLSFKLDVKCKNAKQKKFFNNLKDLEKKVNICDSPAGVGKSLLALTAGLYHLKNGNCSKVIIIVPTVEASDACKIGLLPGSVDEKIHPYTIATRTNIEKILKISGNIAYKEMASQLINGGFIEFELLSFARGRNYDDAFVILDEAENLSNKEAILLMSRMGEGNSKIAIIGDHEQCDRKNFKSLDDCGLVTAIKRLEGVDEITVDRFTNEDIVRNPFLTKLLNAWNQNK